MGDDIPQHLLEFTEGLDQNPSTPPVTKRCIETTPVVNKKKRLKIITKQDQSNIGGGKKQDSDKKSGGDKKR